MQRVAIFFLILITLKASSIGCSAMNADHCYNDSETHTHKVNDSQNKKLLFDSTVTYEMESFEKDFSLRYRETVNNIYSIILTNTKKNDKYINSKEYLFYLVLLNKNSNDNTYIFNTTLDSMGQYYLRSNQLENAFDCFSKIISSYSISEQKEYPFSKTVMTGTAVFFRKYGNKVKAEGKNDKAIVYYKKSLEISKFLGNKQDVANCYNNLGTSYNDMGKNEIALGYLLNSLKINEDLKNKKHIAYCYLNIGAIYQNEGDTVLPMSYYTKALEVALQISDKRCIATCYSNIGGIYNYEGNYIKALEFYRYSLAVFEELQDSYGFNMCLINVGICYMNLDDYNKSLEFLKKALQKSKESNDNFALCSSNLNLAELYMKAKDYRNAIIFANEGLKIAKEINVVNFEHKAYNVLKEACYKEKDYRQAFDFYGLYLRANDSLFNKEKTRQIVEIQTKYETNKKEKEIEIQALKISEQQIQLKQNRIILILLIGLILFTIIFIILLLGRYRIKQRIMVKNQLIEQQKQNTLAIIDIQEKERTRIARDIHDGIGQSLAGIISKFDELNKKTTQLDDQQKEILSNMARSIDEAYAELRNLSHQMMPRALKVAGLSAAISDLLEKTLVNTNISYSFKNEEVENLPESTAISLYRIFQELFGNIIKHAKADKIRVDLLINKSNLILIVEDNGIGYNNRKNTNMPGMGLSNINARVQALQGNFLIEPSSEKGTVATIIVPLN